MSTIKQIREIIGAQTVGGWATVLNRGIRKKLSLEVKFELTTWNKQSWENLRKSLQAKRVSKCRRPVPIESLMCWTDQGGGTRRWPSLKSCSWKVAGPGFTPPVHFEPPTSMLLQEEAKGPLRNSSSNWAKMGWSRAEWEQKRWERLELEPVDRIWVERKRGVKVGFCVGIWALEEKCGYYQQKWKIPGKKHGFQ